MNIKYIAWGSKREDHKACIDHRLFGFSGWPKVSARLIIRGNMRLKRSPPAAEKTCNFLLLSLAFTSTKTRALIQMSKNYAPPPPFQRLEAGEITQR